MSKSAYHAGSIRRFMARAALAAAVLVPLVACALPLPQAATTTLPSGNSTPYPQFSPVVSSGQLIIKTITQFCSAVHGGNLNQAYTFLSSQYKHTITKPSQIPHMVPRGTPPRLLRMGTGRLPED